MSTGPEHYARAEALLGARKVPGANGADSQEEAIALAQVHATLALAAATITAGGQTTPQTGTAWQHVLEPR